MKHTLCKMRYLVLHGYYQSADIIRKKIKGLFPKVNLIIPNGPLKVEDDKYGWFPLNKIDLVNGDITIDETDISTVLDHNLQISPNYFDGVIAFSQGCLAAAVLLGSGKISTSKLLLFSPIPIPKVSWNYTLPSGITCRLYVGKDDTLVSNELSLEFIPALGNNEVDIIEHRWGHVIPTTQQYKLEYSIFFQ